ncbi:hypothetical protein LR48_Vigan08g088400 [Vigna angularis]|uniref:Uncharacterized protein n=1 Tax=Phaseolus angularis TaxID=3914 RepID=A0A0L9V541_PHAAN|nr:hypothetical protein LR48_Vigan08g088400 [Vigna angularis]
MGLGDPKEDPMVSTRNMSSKDLTKIIRALQQHMVEMQHRYEGELVALRIKNVARAAKEKAIDEEDQIVQVKQTVQHSGPVETNQVTGIKVKTREGKFTEDLHGSLPENRVMEIALMPGLFANSLCRRPLKTMKELRE